jgi:putative nucleotidyltransferase with HDIG domain
MQEEQSELIDVGKLRTGLFVVLDIDWMQHPFLRGSFKIASDKQIEAIRGLGLQQVSYVPGRSDPAALAALEVTPSKYPAMSEAELLEMEQQRTEELRRLHGRADQVAAQQLSLHSCERRYRDAVAQYREMASHVLSQPQAVAQQCLGLINRFVEEMTCEGETAIRLLSENLGERGAVHPINVTILSLLLGRAMGLPEGDMRDLGVAAMLHDLGKLQLPERVRAYDEGFSAAEYKLYQEHVVQGEQLARQMGLSKAVQLAIAHHHEQTDGGGYPARLRGESLPLSSKILALVNRYEDLSNPARSSTAMTPHEALSFIFSQLKNRYDSVVLSAFIRMMGVYPPGSIIELVDGRYALVMSVNSSRPLKPRVLIHDPAVLRHEALVVDLERAPEIGIRRSLKPAALPREAFDYLLPRQRIGYFFEPVEREPEPPAS